MGIWPLRLLRSQSGQIGPIYRLVLVDSSGYKYRCKQKLDCAQTFWPFGKNNETLAKLKKHDFKPQCQNRHNRSIVMNRWRHLKLISNYFRSDFHIPLFSPPQMEMRRNVKWIWKVEWPKQEWNQIEALIKEGQFSVLSHAFLYDQQHRVHRSMRKYKHFSDFIRIISTLTQQVLCVVPLIALTAIRCYWTGNNH